MKKNDEPIIVEQVLNFSIETVWNSITKIDQMRQWYFDNIPDFKPEVGFETQFMVQNEDRKFLHLWRVTEVVPLQRIVYTWKYEGYPGDSFVVFELIKNKKFTTLRLTVNVLESFPDDIPEFKRESCLAGWEYFLKESLKKYLDKV